MPTCPGCGSDVPEGAPRCPVCGRAMGRVCRACMGIVPPGGSFCPKCGAPVGYVPPIATARRRRDAMGIVDLVSSYAVLLLLCLLCVNIVLVIYSIWEVVPNTHGDCTSLFLVTPWLVQLVRLCDFGFAFIHVFYVFAIVASFAIMMRHSWRPFKGELTGDRVEHSPLFVTGTLFMAILFFNSLFYFLVGAAGETPTVPIDMGELWESMYALARASVWEEIITRVLYIGVPLLAYHSLKGERGPIGRYLLGGGHDMGRAELSLLIASSAIFALAHVFSWDWYKAIPTFIAGLAFGYLFLRYGLYASITLHFMFDYMSMPMDVWDSLVVVGAIGLCVLAWLIVGMVQFGLYSRAVVDRFRPKRPEPVPEPPGFFICPVCGGTRARYEDGDLVCLDCGTRVKGGQGGA